MDRQLAEPDNSCGTEFLSIKGVSRDTKMSEKYWRKKVDDREIEFVRMGRRILISRKALDEFIAKNTYRPVDREALKSEFRGRL